jgi:hypothetical protein
MIWLVAIVEPERHRVNAAWYDLARVSPVDVSANSPELEAIVPLRDARRLLAASD